MDKQTPINTAAAESTMNITPDVGRIEFPLGIEIVVMFQRRITGETRARVSINGITGRSRTASEAMKLGIVVSEAGRVAGILIQKLTEAGFVVDG